MAGEEGGDADVPTFAQVLEFLIDSARYGDTDDVKMALSQYSAPVNGTDDDGRTGAWVQARLEVGDGCARARERRASSLSSHPRTPLPP
jgi:hypothetical protein